MRLLEAVVRRPGRTAIVATVAALFALVGMAQLRFRGDLLDLLPANDPVVRDLRSAIGDFGLARRLIIAVEAETPTDLGAAGAAIDAFFATLGTLPGIVSVDAGIPAAALRKLAGPDGIRLLPDAAIETLSDRLTPDGLWKAAEEARLRLSDADAAASRELVLADPLDLRGLAMSLAELRPRTGVPMPGPDGSIPMVSDDGRMRLAVLVGARPPEDIDFAQEIVRRVRGAFPPNLAAAGLRLTLGGAYPIAADIAARTRADLLWNGPTAFVLVNAVAWLLYRSVPILLAFGLTLFLALLCTAGASGWLVGDLHVVSTGFAAALLGIGDDFALHVCNRHAHGLERGFSPPDAALAAARGSARGLFAAAATTAGAFGVLLLSRFRGLAQFGLLLGVGVALACAVSLLFLPALLTRVRVVPRDPIRRAARRWGEVVVRLRGPILAVAAALLVGGVLSARGLRVRTGPETIRPDSPAFDEQERVLSRFGNIVEPIVLVLEGKDLEEALQRNETLFDWLAANASRAGGMRIQSLRYLLVSRARDAAVVRRRLPEADDAAGHLDRPDVLAGRPTEAEWTARSTNSRTGKSVEIPVRGPMRIWEVWIDALSSAGFRSEYAWAQGERLRDLLTASHNQAPATPADWREAGLGGSIDASLSEKDGRVRLATTVYPDDATRAAEAVEVLRGAAPALGFDVALTGVAVVRERLGGIVVSDLERLGGVSLGLLLVLLVVTVRRPLGIVASLVPLLFGLAGTIAALRLTGREITIGSLAVFPLLTGLAVDYGIYLWFHFREEGNAAGAIEAHGRAMLASGLTTVLGFGTLVFSSHPALRDLGFAAAVGVGSALVASIVILPAFLGIAGTRRALPPRATA